jgi:hypothetical protein
LFSGNFGSTGVGQMAGQDLWQSLGALCHGLGFLGQGFDAY